MALAYIGLGSNLNGPAQQVSQALTSLSAIQHTQCIRHSSLYGSAPQGPQDQPDFVNAVALIETALTPYELLKTLQDLEVRQGKVKQRHWGERVIDLDILLYDDVEMDDPTLTLPHPCIAQRDFVLLPLQEISPALCIPVQGSVQSLLDKLSEHYVTALADSEKL